MIRLAVQAPVGSPYRWLATYTYDGKTLRVSWAGPTPTEAAKGARALGERLAALRDKLG